MKWLKVTSHRWFHAGQKTYRQLCILFTSIQNNERNCFSKIGYLWGVKGILQGHKVTMSLCILELVLLCIELVLLLVLLFINLKNSFPTINLSQSIPYTETVLRLSTCVDGNRIEPWFASWPNLRLPDKSMASHFLTAKIFENTVRILTLFLLECPYGIV